MTPQAIHEIQLAAVAGCVEYLSGEPKCQIAANKLLTKLRTEQLKLNQQTEYRTSSRPLTPANPYATAPRSSCGKWIGEFITAAIIIGLPIWGSWAYYIVTGRYLGFGVGS